MVIRRRWWRGRLGAMMMQINEQQNHIMLDLETLGTGPHAAIVAIGAVRVFAGQYPRDPAEFYQRVDLRSAVDAGGVMDADTVLWWLQQGDEARKELRVGGQGIDGVLFDLFWWMRGKPGVSSLSDPVVWGNGAAFDNVILANAFKDSQRELPWRFWNDRCYRTVKALFADVEYKPPEIAHHALHDARAQAAHLRAISGRMRQAGELVAASAGAAVGGSVVAISSAAMQEAG